MIIMGKRALPRSKRKSLALGGVVAGGVALPVAVAGPAHADTLSAAEVTALAEKHCPQLSSAELDIAVKVAHGESGWNTLAHNANGENSKGLWQINQDAHGLQYGDLFNPDNNARAMCAISNGGSNWTPWTVYTSGMYLSQPGAVGGGTAPSTPKPKPVAPAPAKPKPQPSKGDTHTVVRGDTLYDIAIDHGVGDGGLDTWKPLYEANRQVVGDNPHLIFPGQVLDIPGAAKGKDAPAPKPTALKPTPKPSGYVSPVEGGVTQAYRNPGNYAAGFHTGVDFACSTGQAVRSAGPGTVVATGGEGAAYGNHVKVKHPDGRFTLYAHLNSVSVSNGQSVEGGTVVGTCGNTGTSTGAHLHFEVRAGSGGYNDHVDPLAWLSSHGVK